MHSRPFLDSISGWARRACGQMAREMAPGLADDPHLYALGAWPDLPEGLRTAAVYRLLSVMTVRPVPRQWMARQSGLGPDAIEALLQWLDGIGVLVCHPPDTPRAPVPCAPARTAAPDALLPMV